MNKQDRIDLVLEAEQKIAEAISNIQDAVKGTPEETECNTYIVGHLNTWIGNGNPYDHHTGKIVEALEEWDGLGEGDGYCLECTQVKPQEDFYDEVTCAKCYEKHLEE